MSSILLSWVLACMPHTPFDICDYEQRVFQYVTGYTPDNSEVIPYRTRVDMVCSETPEWCRAIELAKELGDAIRRGNK